MVVNVRTDLLPSLSPQQLNAALIERHQAGSSTSIEGGQSSSPASSVQNRPVSHLGVQQPDLIAGLRESSDTEMALVWQYAELERQRAENAAILDAADEAMVLISADHRLVNANRRFCELLGSRRERLLGLHVHQIRPILLSVFGTDEFCLLLRWNRNSALAQHLLIEQSYPEPRRYDLMISDVDALGHGEHGRLFSLRDISSQLELDRQKDEFVATVSHELRTPLTSIAGFIDLLQRGSAGELPSQAQAYLDIVQRNVSSLVEQVEELLEFSRLESGACKLVFDQVDLHSALNEAVATISPMIADCNHRLAIDVADTIPPVCADRSRLVQVLVNLLSNANRYTLEGGSISVSARSDAAHVRVDISDTGIGLSPREQELIFTRFYRAHEEAHPQIGSGLGLPITKSLIERMGGSIWVQSAPSQGSTFSFTVPVAV